MVQERKQTNLVAQWPLLNTLENQLFAEVGNHLGDFQIQTRLNFDSTVIGNEMGVHFNIFNPQGQFLEGEIPFDVLDLENLTPHTKIDLLDSHNQATYNSIFVPLQYQGVVVGYVSASIPQSMTFNKIAETVVTLTIIALAIIASVGIITILLISRFTAPLVHIAKALKDISEGDGDLRNRLTVASSDEIGEIGLRFNQFIEKIHSMVLAIQNNAEVLSTSAHELSKGALEMRATSDSISTSIDHEFEAMNQSATTIDSMVHALEIIFKKMKLLQKKANDAMEVATHGSEAVEATDQNWPRR